MKKILKACVTAFILILALSDFCKAEEKSLDNCPVNNVTNQSL